MNTNTLARHYDRLGAEERFRLIVAAGARDDVAEQDRLCLAAPRITLVFSHHAPWAQAFDQLATLVYVELQEEIAKHQDAYERWCDTTEDRKVEEEEQDEEDADEDEKDEDEKDDKGVHDDDVTALDVPDPPIWVRMLELYYAQGFILKTKIAGWRLLCKRFTLPPDVLWKSLPGFDRLQRAIELLEDRRYGPPPAFEPEGMLHWLTRLRPDNLLGPTGGSLISPQRFADDLEKTLRECVKLYGG